MYENHAQDARVRQVDVVPTLSAKAGMGGNNLPIVMSAGFKGGQSANMQTRGIGYEVEKSPTLLAGTVPDVLTVTETIPEKPIVFEPGIASRDGGHIYTDGKAPTLRAEPGDNRPTVVYPLEGNGARESHKGPGFSESDKMFTLNTVEQHAVAYCIAGPMVDRETTMHGNEISEEVSSTLTAADRHAVYCMGHDERSAQFSPDVTDPLTGSDYKQPPVVAQVSTRGGQSAYAVGNGQLHQANLQDKTGALNCMHDQIAIMQEVAQGSKSSEACAPMTDEDSTDRT